MAAIESIHPFRCSDLQRQCLERMFTLEEIRKEFFDLPPDKAPGPDGYTGEFFRHCWGIVGNEVVVAVMSFFFSGKMEPHWNSTITAMVPKTLNADSAAEFRPISCLNAIYKVVANLLARGLQSLLPLMISEKQTAFVSGRLIVENVLLASEMVQGYDESPLTGL